MTVVGAVTGGDDITMYGGRGISGCTTGFNVIGSTNRGTTTAAHCANAQSYSGYALTFVSEHSGNYGDVQVHRLSGHSFPNQFYANTGCRAVTGTGAAITSQQMCLQGQLVRLPLRHGVPTQPLQRQPVWTGRDDQ